LVGIKAYFTVSIMFHVKTVLKCGQLEINIKFFLFLIQTRQVISYQAIDLGHRVDFPNPEIIGRPVAVKDMIFNYYIFNY